MNHQDFCANCSTDGNYDAIEKELQENLLRKVNINKPDVNGDTALMIACTYEACRIVKLLLEYKADPGLKNAKNNQTALDIAQGKPKVMAVIEEHLASLKSEETPGLPPRP